MALENINVWHDLITFIDRTPDDFTAQVALTRDEVTQLYNALHPRPVMILNTDKQVKAAILCDRLTWQGIAHSYELVGVCHCVSVAESDVKAALGSDL